MQLKKKIRFLFENYKQSINNQKFILIFCLLLIMAVYGIFGIANHGIMTRDYISGFLLIILYGNYALFTILIVLLNTSNIYNVFSTNQNYIIRLKSHKQYLTNLIENIVFSNTMLLVVNFILVMIGLNVFNPVDLTVKYYFYDISGLVYLIYAIIRFIVLSHLISIMFILISKILNNKLAFLITLLFCLSIVILPSSATWKIISSLFDFPLLIGYYFNAIHYSSFLFEIICFLLYCSVLCLIDTLLYKLAIKHMKTVVK